MPLQAPASKRTVLRDLIDARGLRYDFVAGKVGLSPSNFTKLMNGERTLTASVMVTLCKVLEVEAEAFFDGRELLPSRQTQEGVEDAGGGGHVGTLPALGASA
jgi:transcriptional regulator with XRE-family HTH domain